MNKLDLSPSCSMEKKDSEPKWEAKVSTRLEKASADQIFCLFKDFFGLHKWFPSLSTSYGIHGENGEVGCIRYCTGFSLRPPESDRTSTGEAPVSVWSKERLMGINPIERILSYEIVDSNIGFNSYFSTVRIVPDEVDGLNGCVIEWCITVDPVEGMRLEDLINKYDAGLQGMAKNMEDALPPS
ncbi:putative monoglyceride lipase-like [Capsicum annuum]|nr:lachrymatory-factor synthase isoform X2 [Capsicum annuum]XP_047267245.1 lachrymatory-factor synthase isoform X2 [Capsicum annuum]KAF3675758.1 putative monoglyceride lipase-like [Capsicum annuum]